MSFWSRRPGPQSNTPKIRVEKIAKTTAAPKIAPRNTPKQSQPGPASAASTARKTFSSGNGQPAKLKPPKQTNSRKRSPAFQRVESDSSDDEDSALDELPSKRQKLPQQAIIDVHRQLRAQNSFSEVDNKRLIHAAGIASRELHFGLAFNPSEEDDPTVYLQYPGSSFQERYELVYRRDCFNPIEEIIEVIKDFASFFLDAETEQLFNDPDSGIIRRLERARNLKSLASFKQALSDCNSAVEPLRRAGILGNALGQKHSLPEKLVIRIMTQTYDRAVSPKVDLLKKYENGTDEIYGELKSNFVFKILTETQINSTQVFMDLGSGVANVVLQAALQIGCESWGCEIMENACKLAEAQKLEFEARCRLWGIEPGSVRLERGDFMKNDNIRDVIKRADVVLVNNEVFTPELNNDLVNLFLDLKEGCKIVSLKSFVPQGHKIRSYNLNNPVNLLDVERKSYSTKSVSWKDDGGDYFIATKDSRRLQLYEDLT